MNTSYGINTYRAHDLNIAMKTSSGDVIKMDFANHQSASMSHEKNQNGSLTSMSFSSMQSFKFSVEGNGIDAQDQKEIEAFMKVAKPYIDSFLQELEDAAPKSPVSQLAQKIASIFEPSRERDENTKNHIKTNIVEMFDKSMRELKMPEKSEQLDPTELMEKIFEQTKKLLERTLQEFDEFNKNIYA